MSFSSAAVARCAPFAVFIALLAARGFAESWGIDGSLSYGVQAGATALVLLYFLRRYSELAAAPGAVTAWVATVAVGLGVFVLWINATLPWMRLGDPVAGFDGVGTDGALRWDLIAVRAFGAVLVVPLMEELFWRSFLMRWLDARDFLTLPPRAASWFAVLISSAVFALAHDLWLAGFIAGLIYAELYRRTGNLWYPIAAHAITNLALAVWVVQGRHWSFW